MLSVENLSFNYDKYEVLLNISFQVAPGRFIAILGANGAGKTTLFKCLLGLEKPKKGIIKVDGKLINDLSADQLSKIIAYVPQENPQSFNHFVIDIVEMGGQQLEADDSLEKAYQILTDLGIEKLAMREYMEISGGQRQLVRIAQALMQNTPLILMDEPTNNLDYGNQLYVLNLCRELKDTGRTIIMTSHQPQDVLNFCDQALLLSEGEVLIYDDVELSLRSKYIKELYDINVDLDYKNSSYPPQILPHITKRIDEYSKYD